MSAQIGRQQSLSFGLSPTRYGLDPILCLVVAILLAWGLVMVASASVAISEKITGVSTAYFVKRQLAFAVLGLGCGALAFTVPMRSWESAGPLLLMLALFLLVLVLIPGVGLDRNKARRWIDFGLFQMQASEPARLAVVLYLAGYIVRRQLALQTKTMGLLAPFIPLAFVSGFLLKEPDFGATAILLAISMLMLFMAGARLRDLAIIGGSLIAALGVIAIWAPYRVNRLMRFFDTPGRDSDGNIDQLGQALIAVGRGEWFGVGLGNSLQKLLYLPEMHTDFIFAILAEEFGLFGVLILIGLFGLLVWRGFVIGQAAEQLNCRFNAYVCYGLSSWFGLQSLINMAVNMGAVPTKGLALPFISYGGSSLITVCVMVALILRVDYENRFLQAGHPSARRTTKIEPTPLRRTPAGGGSRREQDGTGLFAFFRRRGARS